MSKGGAEKFIIPLIIGGIVGFFIGYAVNYSSDEKEGKADPVAIAAASDIDIAPRPVGWVGRFGADVCREKLYQVRILRVPSSSPSVSRQSALVGSAIHMVA